MFSLVNDDVVLYIYKFCLLLLCKVFFYVLAVKFGQLRNLSDFKNVCRFCLFSLGLF